MIIFDFYCLGCLLLEDYEILNHDLVSSQPQLEDITQELDETKFKLKEENQRCKTEIVLEAHIANEFILHLVLNLILILLMNQILILII
jgi:hypothetical protein